MNHQCATGVHPDPAYGCYTHHSCRCDGCTRANTEASADLHAVRRRLGREQLTFVPAELTRARVRWLRDQGASDTWISEHTTLSPAAVGYVRRGLRRGEPMRWTKTVNAESVAALTRRVARGEIQPPRFREARGRQLRREERRAYRVSA